MATTLVGSKSSAATRVRLVIFSLLWVIVVLNFVDRSALSIALPYMKTDLGLSSNQEGWILGAFFWTYLIMQVPSGFLLDRVGPRKVIGAAGIIWGVFQALIGLVTSSSLLFAARLGLGAGEAPMFPAGAKLNSNWLASVERARGATFIDAAAPLGAALGGLITTALIGVFGSWRWAFIITGIVTIGVTILYCIYLRDTPEQHPGVNEAEREHIRAGRADPSDAQSATVAVLHDEPSPSAGQYLRSPSFWSFMAGRLGWALVWWGIISWVPSYLVHALHFDLARLGWGTALIYGVGFIGEMLSGVISDAARARFGHGNGVMKIILGVSGLIAAVAVLCLPLVDNGYLALALLSVAVFFILFGGLYWAIPAWLAPRGQVGLVGGVMNVASAAGGGLAPVVMGYAIEASGGSYSGAFVFLGFCALLYVAGSLGIDFSRPLARPAPAPVIDSEEIR